MIASLKGKFVSAAAAMGLSVAVVLFVVASASGGSFPGLNGKIAFDSDRGDPGVSSQIYVMSADGSGQTALTSGSSNFLPYFSSDGSKIVFDSTRDGNTEVYSMNADGSGQTRLTNNPASDTLAQFSPDGSKIVFRSSRDGNSEIYVMNADGSGQTRLTNNTAIDSNPTWSPDGTKIAFDSDRDTPGGDVQVYQMNADGSNQTRLTSLGASNSVPNYSPDGKKIAFDSNRDGNVEIYVLNPDLSQTRLTNNSAADQYPYYSPDGQKILFASDRNSPGGNFQVYSMNADGSGQTRLTNNAFFDTDPSFQSLQPPNTFTFGALVRNKKKGIAKLTVNVPTSGQLTLSGSGVVPQRSARATASTTAPAAGPVKLTIKAKGKKRKTLLKKGKVKLRLTVTFTPTFPVSGTTQFGTPSTQTKSVVLKKKL